MNDPSEVEQLYATARSLWLTDELTPERLAAEAGYDEERLRALDEHATAVFHADQMFLAGEIAALARVALASPLDLH